MKKIIENKHGAFVNEDEHNKNLEEYFMLVRLSKKNVRKQAQKKRKSSN